MPAFSQRPAVESIDVLLVEDSPHDVRLLREAFEMTETNGETNLHVVTSGSEALAFLGRSAESDADSPPNLVLLDLNLPDHDGLEVLETINAEPTLRRLPTVVLTSSDATDDIARCYDANASAYLTKPTDLDGFVSLVESIERFWLTQVQLPPMSA
ncbi:response regulator [Haloterrigena alkaliphila]|uniref:Response regulator n=1 Tax=Haloterrigena alkaliphila TaxID=2816475 RepID=A0A8A2VCK6_9EURY|nr:response regulator [Haloterrigena alkaliphila]QSW97935.1 response regulator [Haloterrigena alkaliphila]